MGVNALHAITDLDGASRENLSPQATAVGQSTNYICVSEPFKVRAGFAESETSQCGLAYLKLSTHQMVERNAARHNVAACLPGPKPNAVVAFQRFQSLDLDERNLVVRLGLPEGAEAEEVPIPFESLGGDGAHFF